MEAIDVFSYSQLRAEIGAGQLRREVQAGNLTHLRHGWYAGPKANSQVVAALRTGGRLACLSALREYGVWVPPGPGLHVDVRRSRAVRSGAKNVHVHPVKAWTSESPIVPLPTALAEVARFHSAETSLIVAESAVNSKLVTLAGARSIMAVERPRDAANAFLSGSAQSGTESRVRLHLQRHHVPVLAQVSIHGVGRVDLLVGNSLVVELDSRAHHTAAENYAKDRARDLELVRLGYRVIRLTYQQVFHEWSATQLTLSSVLSSRAHRRRPRKTGQ